MTEVEPKMTVQGTPQLRIDVESMRLYFATIFAQMRSRVSIETIRPLPVFLGLNPGNELAVAPKAFSSPLRTIDRSCPGKLQQRIKVNCTYFLSNYVLVASMTALVVALMHPGMLITVAVVYGLWWVHGFLIRHELILFGIAVQNLMTVQQRFYVLFIITALCIAFACLVPALIFVFISTLIIVCHASLRDTSQLDDTAVSPSRLEVESGNNDEESELFLTPKPH